MHLAVTQPIPSSLLRILVRDHCQRGDHPGSADWNRDAHVYVLHQLLPARHPVLRQPGRGFAHRRRSAAPPTDCEDLNAP